MKFTFYFANQNKRKRYQLKSKDKKKSYYNLPVISLYIGNSSCKYLAILRKTQKNKICFQQKMFGLYKFRINTTQKIV